MMGKTENRPKKIHIEFDDYPNLDTVNGHTLLMGNIDGILQMMRFYLFDKGYRGSFGRCIITDKYDAHDENRKCFDILFECFGISDSAFVEAMIFEITYVLRNGLAAMSHKQQRFVDIDGTINAFRFNTDDIVSVTESEIETARELQEKEKLSWEFTARNLSNYTFGESYTAFV